ncbi:MAG: CHAT domain-containing tetratricopeptide repeat protein, partial [Bacteroidota bacterium]
DNCLGEFKISKGQFFGRNSQFPEALAFYQAAAEISKDQEDGKLIHADALLNAGLIFERLGNYDSSLVYLNRAYPIYQENLDTTSLKFASIYNGFGNTYFRLNQFAEAKAYYLKSKDLSENQLGRVSSDLAIALGNLSAVSRSEGDYKQAVQYSEQALKIHRALKDESGISSDYYALGIYHYFMGDYGRAKDYVESCIALREKLFNEKHYSLIDPYQVLGIVSEESGDYQKALAYLQKARPVIVANFGVNSMAEGNNFENTALCYKNVGQLDSALYFIEKASAIQQAANNISYALGIHYFNYASILYELNGPQEAKKLLVKSTDIYTQFGMGKSSEFAQNMMLYGMIASEENNWAVADDRFEKALEIIRLPAYVEAKADAYLLTPNALLILNEYSNYLYKKYQNTDDTVALEDFKTYSTIYLDLSDRFRKQFIDGYTKGILIKDNAVVYNRNIGIYNQLYRASGNEAYLNAAYNFSELGRASLLRDIQDDKIQSYAGLPDTILQKEASLKKQIAQLNQQLLDDPNSEMTREALLTAKEDLNSFIDDLTNTFPAYYDLKFNTSILSLEQIQARLTGQDNLVEYMQDDTAYYALVARKDTKALLHLGNRAVINGQIQQWRAAIVSQDRENLQSIGNTLYQKLWQPLEGHLSGEQVTIVPCGPLFYLNFETLPLDASDFLIERYNINYSLSFYLQFSEDRATRGKKIMAVAPGFEDAIKAQYSANLDSLEIPDQEFLNTVRQPWSIKLVTYLKQKYAPLSLTGTMATESNVKANIQEGNILYFGTHAIADPSDPLRSKLVLAKEIGAQKEDGYLHAYEFFGLPLEAELAVLNACESGLGGLQEGEGMISLAYSLHFAGCPSTVMSLWKVDEKISTNITQTFLNYLNEGLPKSAALRQAKLDYLESADPNLKHPFYWGGMVLMGKDGTVTLKRKSANWPYWLLTFGLSVLLFWAGNKYKTRLAS